MYSVSETEYVMDSNAPGGFNAVATVYEGSREIGWIRNGEFYPMWSDAGISHALMVFLIHNGV